MPALRERLDDVPLLARTLLESINRSMRCSYQLQPEVFDVLKGYHFPGNIRELRNILFIAATHSYNNEISGDLIQRVIRNLPHSHDTGQVDSRQADLQHANMTPVENGGSEPAPAIAVQQLDGAATLKDIEAQHIAGLLEKYGGNRKKTAEALGISERTIYRKIKELGIV